MSVVAPSISAQGRGGGSRVAAVIATLASPILLYLVIRAVIVGLNATTAAILPPTDQVGIVQEALPAVIDIRRPLPPQVVPVAQKAALTAPFEPEPFIVYSRKAAGEGDLPRAIQLMEEARRRGPNNLATRFMLTAYYIQAKREPEAVTEIDYILRSNEAARGLLLPELVKALGDGRARRTLAQMLAAKPNWRNEFVKIAQEKPVRPEDARQLMDEVRAARPGIDLSPERSLYLQALVKSGRGVQARNVWLQTYPQAERARHQLLYDGAFSAPPAPQPFGWKLHDLDAGRAEIVRVGGGNSHLEVNYFGGKSVVLAEQMLALPPGSYRLSFNARSEGEVTSGELYWSLSCLPGEAELARIRVQKPQPDYRKYQGEVRVGSGCSGQSLRLVAEPGDVAAAFTIRIAGMQMVRR
jgi:hypothetical protein